MVKLRELPRDTSGAVSLAGWLEQVEQRHAARDIERIRSAAQYLRDAFESSLPQRAASQLALSVEIADTVLELGPSDETIIAALFYRAVREGALHPDSLAEDYGDDIAHVVQAVLRMGTVTLESLSAQRVRDVDAAEQLASVRRMLVDMIDDARVPVIKLAERIVALRHARDASEARRRALAVEVQDVFAPLANRLGIGRFRWELEDLAFRCLRPDAYQAVARMLSLRRAEREAQIAVIAEQVRLLLEAHGVNARVEGRAKHIYSIWRKMRDKGIPFSRVYDVRAVRVIVPEVATCYTALGVVHTQWRHLEHEFDDYIANPKQNGYRSIHTAVFGPDGKPLEIQIRTEEMHADAELGVCAHWSYKGADSPGKDDAGYEHKLAWLRRVLDSHEESDGLPALGEQIREGFLREHVYVLTPDGDVIDLVKGATPVDFAYRIHTEIGHGCIGALVDGRNVALNTVLESGQAVEVITGNQTSPPLDWLNPHLGYVRSSRARAKIRAFLRSRGREVNIDEGRRYLDRELARFGNEDIDRERLARWLGHADGDAMHEAIGSGACTIADVITAMAENASGNAQLSLLPEAPVAAPGQILHVIGAGDAPAYRARCCAPNAGDAIAGYFEEQGVRVHTEDCEELRRLAADDRTRYVRLRWGRVPHPDRRTLRVEGFDRSGLLRDVSAVLADAGVEVTAVVAGRDVRPHRAVIDITLSSPGIIELGPLVDRLLGVSNVTSVTSRPA